MGSILERFIRLIRSFIKFNCISKGKSFPRNVFDIEQDITFKLLEINEEII